jgi:hypothetical protein
MPAGVCPALWDKQKAAVYGKKAAGFAQNPPPFVQ